MLTLSFIRSFVVGVSYLLHLPKFIYMRICVWVWFASSFHFILNVKQFLCLWVNVSLNHYLFPLCFQLHDANRNRCSDFICVFLRLFHFWLIFFYASFSFSGSLFARRVLIHLTTTAIAITVHPFQHSTFWYGRKLNVYCLWQRNLILVRWCKHSDG